MHFKEHESFALIAQNHDSKIIKKWRSEIYNQDMIFKYKPLAENLSKDPNKN